MPENVFAYVVLCHHKPEQALRLARTIRRLSPDSRVLLRHDQASGYIGAKQAAAAGAELLVSEIHPHWGHWSLVEATLEAFAEARKRFDPAWTVLISGQDYPIKPLKSWEDEVLSEAPDAVVPSVPLVTTPIGLRFRDDDDGLRVRYTHRWTWLPQLGVVPKLPRGIVRATRAVWYQYLSRLQTVIVLNELPRGGGWVLGRRRRRMPFRNGVVGRKGEQWVGLGREAVSAVLDSEPGRAWQRFFATTLIPDEAYFATMLAETPGIVVRNARISWLQWDDDVTRPHPVTLSFEQIPLMANADAPFARKFSESEQPGLLDEVDRRLLDLDPEDRSGT